MVLGMEKNTIRYEIKLITMGPKINMLIKFPIFKELSTFPKALPAAVIKPIPINSMIVKVI